MQANADTVTVDCGRETGTLKGFHQHFCELGFPLFTDIQKLKPYLEDIGASFLRVGSVPESLGFQGKTIEDAQDPAMYDFSLIDTIAQRTHELGLEMFYILKVPKRKDAENASQAYPHNLDVVAETVRRTVLHLTQGWADGHHYPIQYWEVGNEPDLDVFGRSWSLEGYCETYEAAARAVKSVPPPPGIPEYKVGGPSLAYPGREWGWDFVRYCDAHALPLDFLSFHVYKDDPGEYGPIIREVHDFVRSFPRYADTELILNEWNVVSDIDLAEWVQKSKETTLPRSEFSRKFIHELVSSPKFDEPAAAMHMARVLMAMERSPLDKAGHFLLADNGDVKMGVISCPDSYVPGFIPEPPPDATVRDAPIKPKLKYHVLRAFHMLEDTPQLVEIALEAENLDGLAGIAPDKRAATVLLANWGKERTVALELRALPWTTGNENTPFHWRQQILELTSPFADDPLRDAAAGNETGRDFTQNLTVPAQSIVVVRVWCGALID